MSKKLTMLLNLGTHDAERLGIDPDEAKEGMTVTVGPKVAEELTKRGWASEDGNAPAPSAEPQPQAKAAPAGIPVAITENPGTATVSSKKTTARAAGTATPETADADTSPLSEENADEAIAHIGRMTSKPRLQQIAANDKRVTVQRAATERLKAL